jgi:hypothetical protein
LAEVRERSEWRRKRVMPDTMVAVKKEKKAPPGEELGALGSRVPEDKTEIISEGLALVESEKGNGRAYELRLGEHRRDLDRS